MSVMQFANPPGSTYNPLSVKSYGALGDGSTDDTAALQAAINAAITQARPLYLPTGTYLTSAPVGPTGTPTTLTGFCLFGDGNSSVIRPKDTGFSFANGKLGVLTIPGNSSNVLLRDFLIYGGATNRPASQTVGVADGQASALAISAHTCLVENVEVSGFGAAGFDALLFNGFGLTGAQYVTFVGCRSIQCGVCISFFNTNNIINFYGLRTQSSGFITPNAINQIIFGGPAEQILFSGCEIDEAINASGSNGGKTIWFNSTTNVISRVVFDTCNVYSFTGKYALNMDGSAISVLVRNSHFYPFGGNADAGGAVIATGSTLTTYDSTFGSSGTGKAATGGGTIKYGNCVFSGTKDVSTNVVLY